MKYRIQVQGINTPMVTVGDIVVEVEYSGEELSTMYDKLPIMFDKLVDIILKAKKADEES